MLRIYFTSDDIMRTRIAPEPDPLWELVLSLQMLRPQRGDLFFATWRRLAGRALRNAQLGEILSLLLALTPNVGYFPDFLNPAEAARGVEHGLEAIRRTPKSHLHRDLRVLAAYRKLPGAARGLANGEPGLLVALTEAMRACYDLIVTPYKGCIETALGRDRRMRGDALARHGVEGLLGTLRPMAVWSAGELRVPGHRDQELHLNGRGLRLVPSYFCVSGPLTMLDPGLPPVLIIPVPHGPGTVPGETGPGALGMLIGVTRAGVLEAIGVGDGVTTGELARRTGISAASASEHATVLREAGLVFSIRDRNRMLHSLTSLGHALLNGR
ncbi:winged helix-turn-helix domain-containing protein [Nonomuraea zeae]|uniref:Winged helix-turn-helix transcriptional regulator n=1 Tax=Nonomuraea zeae TaxID=1642303 RepID=A0A5S4GN55_9ACTN|nr:winged helix-turn-helix domain-containing protein [Nonomuraea zeae]TMR34376.1 winged helix-turn-helix transcriptional regulator [Nonomuraea zeae]